jgi:catechol 2,3-dioxygenase-like lactoylglutathione lyase family enzyme
MPVGLVDHFNIVIAQSQAEDTLRFYKDVVGLREGFRPDFGRPGWWLYAGEHPVLHISVRQVAPTAGPTGSVDHIALNATDWPEMKARLERHKVTWREQLVEGNRVGLQVFFKDCNGLVIELDYPRDQP